MSLRKFLTMVFACTATSSVYANAPPPEVSSLFGEKTTAGSFTVIRKLTAEQRVFFWKDTVRSPDGYLRVQTTSAYVDIVSDFRSEASKLVGRALSSPFSSSDDLPDNLVYRGSIPEDENRSTFVFDNFSGGAALTVWNFKKAGAKVSVIEEALNQMVSGNRGTLALNVTEKSRKAIWKLAWWDAGRAYELYVPETLNAEGRPARRGSDIVRLGATLARQFRLK